MFKGASRSLQIQADKKGRKKKRLPPEKKVKNLKQEQAMIAKKRRQSKAMIAEKRKAWAESVAARHG